MFTCLETVMPKRELRMIQSAPPVQTLSPQNINSYKHSQMTHKTFLWSALPFPPKQRPNKQSTAETLLHIFTAQGGGICPFWPSRSFTITLIRTCLEHRNFIEFNRNFTGHRKRKKSRVSVMSTILLSCPFLSASTMY
jgi:hypothetical protein